MPVVAGSFVMGHLLMKKLQNIPTVFPLNDESVFYLSIAGAWLDVFPAALREHARLKSPHLHRYIRSKEISAYGLLSIAYIGVAPMAASYGRFMTQANRVNKLEPHAQSNAFRKDAVLRENNAASELGMSRGELKRLLERLGELASNFGFASYAATFNCKDEILQDPSPFAPADRETYAEGPLYLWDFAKAVNEHKLGEMSFDTFDGWVLFAHLENGVVYGHAIHPVAHRFGDFSVNPLIDFSELQKRGFTLSTIIEVPREVQESARALADRCFPGNIFELVPPPMILAGDVLRSKSIGPELRRRWSEV
jgi:hypothetical protein